MTKRPDPVDPYGRLPRDELVQLERLMRVVDRFREIDGAFPASYMMAFMLVAHKPGGGPTDYAPALGTIPPIASRMLLEIGEHARRGGDGYGLIERTTNPEDLRAVSLRLTRKGRELWARISRDLGDIGHA